jgi:DNA-binding XRE family transcriptional regulator
MSNARLRIGIPSFSRRSIEAAHWWPESTMPCARFTEAGHASSFTASPRLAIGDSGRGSWKCACSPKLSRNSGRLKHTRGRLEAATVVQRAATPAERCPSHGMRWHVRGRLVVRFSSRSVFGRPIRLATRRAAAAFKERYYKRSYSRTAPKPRPPDQTHVPADWAHRLRRARRELRLTQAQLAEKIGTARKAVVYQWESGKRRPSPVFWRRIDDLFG